MAVVKSLEIPGEFHPGGLRPDAELKQDFFFFNVEMDFVKTDQKLGQLPIKYTLILPTSQSVHTSY